MEIVSQNNGDAGQKCESQPKSSTSSSLAHQVARRFVLPAIAVTSAMLLASFCLGYIRVSNAGADNVGRIRAISRLLYEEEHKPLFPLDSSDKWGLGFASVALMIAAGGGIGGGGMLVPIFIIVMGFSPKHAIPLSNITVLGGAAANTLVNWNKRHPLADRPLIDWDLILVMEPLTIGGALIGAILNKLLPEQVLVIMLVLLLSFTAYTTLTKAVSMYKKESKALRERQPQRFEKQSELTKLSKEKQQKAEDEAGEALLEHMEVGSGDDDYLEEVDDPHAYMTDGLKQIIDEEREIPLGNVTVIVALFVVVLFINVMKGGGAFPSPLGIECGSFSFWMSNIAMILWIFIILFFGRVYLIHRYHEKQRVHFPYVEGDIKWDEKATIVYPGICCFAGFFSGMFGIGGGIVKGPLMLWMEVHPAVASASTATMILFTCFTASTSFIVFGLLIWDYAFICILVGFFTTLVGQYGLSYLMKKYQRNSYIAFSVGIVVLLSAFLMTIQSLISMAEGRKGSTGGVCSK